MYTGHWHAWKYDSTAFTPLFVHDIQVPLRLVVSGLFCHTDLVSKPRGIH